MKKNYNELIKYLDERFADVNRRFNDVDRRFEEMDSNFSHLKGDFSQLQGSVDAIAKTTQDTKIEVKVIAHRTQRLEAWVIKAAKKIHIQYNP